MPGPWGVSVAEAWAARAGHPEADAGEAKRHWSTWTINLVDGDPAYGWLSDKGVTLPHALNFELAGNG